MIGNAIGCSAFTADIAERIVLPGNSAASIGERGQAAFAVYVILALIDIYLLCFLKEKAINK
jgi:hypothetical protein